jgi:hypothetical protein
MLKVLLLRVKLLRVDVVAVTLLLKLVTLQFTMHKR